MRCCLPLLIVVLSISNCRGVQLVFDPVLDTVLRGIPTIVRVGYDNTTNHPVTVMDLRHPFVMTVAATWSIRGKKLFEPTLKDLHYSSIPDVIYPPLRPLAAGNHRRWLAFVLTPLAAEPGDVCQLELRFHVDPRQVNFTPADLVVSRDLTVSNEINSKVTDIFGPSITQALLNYESGEQNLGRKLKDRKLRKIVAASERGDSVATLIVFNRQVTQGFDPTKIWMELNDAPRELRVIRNYLLITHYKYYARKEPLSVRMANKFRPSIKPDEPLKPELDELFESAIDY